MNAERIAEIKERCHEVTPGPWGIDKGRKVVALSENWKTEVATTSFGMRGLDDAIFIAHSREDIPFLLLEIESLQSQLSASQARERAAACGVKITNRGIDVSGECDIGYYLICPSCGAVVGDAEYNELNGDYCSNCGQRLALPQDGEVKQDE